ncbi:histidinol-phosphate transaminase [Brachybacterium subflavum]|uniref:histidinol-phosphate transaminase n=1 Tax=Brachybacterium subflavum TaxID=2585206 RepID=UPI00126682FC|nr:histidinol-phosphate transaminase [Brachybacterium subflavum]
MPETPAENIRLRSALDALPAYVPGKPAADDGVRRFKVSSNESPFEPLPQVIEAVNRATLHANLYPDMGALALREAIAHHHSTPHRAVGPESIALSTGSVAVSGDLVRALVDQGDEVVFAWRSFEAYPILVRSHGGVDVQVPLTPAFEHDLPAMADAITDRTRLVILCTPNNPTGPALTTAQIEDFLARVPDRVVVALDEAYREFVDPVRLADTARLFAEHGNVVLLRTFSKMQGIAGLRVGYAVAHPRLAAALGQVTVPFGASSIAQAAALSTFEPDAAAELEHRAAWIREQRVRLEQVLAAQGWELPVSQGNFVYFPLGERSAEFAAFADARGLVVRAYGADGVRVTVGEREANDLLLSIAQEWREAQEDASGE